MIMYSTPAELEASEFQEYTRGTHTLMRKQHHPKRKLDTQARAWLAVMIGIELWRPTCYVMTVSGGRKVPQLPNCCVIMSSMTNIAKILC